MSQDNSNWQQQVWQQPAAPQGTPSPSGFAGVSGQPLPGYGQHPGWAPPPPRKSRAWIVALTAVILAFLLIAMGMHSCSSLISSSARWGSSSSSDLDLLTGDAVGVITLDGTIQYDGTTCSPEGLKAQLDKAAASPRIKAVVLRVNSGGGTATAGEEMAAYVRQFREDSGKPVVVSSASLNASAAYEISSQADYIFTAKTTAIGAIGTALQITDMSELLGKLGISVENFTSSDSKDSSYGTRALTDEERAYYQNMVDQINETFIQSVAEGRGMEVDQVRALATGLTFTGMEAVGNGLADEVGTREDAISKAAELAGLSSYQVASLAADDGDLAALLNLLSQSDASMDDAAFALKELTNHGNLAR